MISNVTLHARKVLIKQQVKNCGRKTSTAMSPLFAASMSLHSLVKVFFLVISNEAKHKTF